MLRLMSDADVHGHIVHGVRERNPSVDLDSRRKQDYDGTDPMTWNGPRPNIGLSLRRIAAP